MYKQIKTISRVTFKQITSKVNKKTKTTVTKYLPKSGKQFPSEFVNLEAPYYHFHITFNVYSKRCFKAQPILNK